MTDTERKYFLLGQAVRRSMVAAKTPVAYLYNGVRLPKLPEWDETENPYATIILSSGVYYLGVWGAKSTTGATGLVSLLPQHRRWKLVDGQWEYFVGITGNSGNPVWANYDILSGDGSVFLTASDPIPIYE